jgi:glycine dehydrogenase
VIGEPDQFDFSKADEFFGVIVQNPDNFGLIHDLSQFSAKLKEKKVIVCCAADIMSLILVKPPGEMGVDIAVGSTQRFGLPMGFGGPHSGYMACKDEFKRKMPGRIIGVSKDSQGNPCYRMAMQTRE